MIDRPAMSSTALCALALCCCVAAGCAGVKHKPAVEPVPAGAPAVPAVSAPAPQPPVVSPPEAVTAPDAAVVSQVPEAREPAVPPPVVEPVPPAQRVAPTPRVVVPQAPVAAAPAPGVAGNEVAAGQCAGTGTCSERRLEGDAGAGRLAACRSTPRLRVARHAAPADQGHRYAHQAFAQEPGGRSAGQVSRLPQAAGNGDAARVAPLLRHAAAQGALAAAGQRSAARAGHRPVARRDLGHPRRSQEVHRIQSDGRSNNVSTTRNVAGPGRCDDGLVFGNVARRGGCGQRRRGDPGPDGGDRIAGPAVRACRQRHAGRARTTTSPRARTAIAIGFSSMPTVAWSSRNSTRPCVRPATAARHRSRSRRRRPRPER